MICSSHLRAEWLPWNCRNTLAQLGTPWSAYYDGYLAEKMRFGRTGAATCKMAGNETRRDFLTRGGISGALGLRALSGQVQNSKSDLPGLEADEPTRSLVLHDVTVIDGRGGPPMRGMTVSIAGDTIQSVEPTSKRSAPGGSRVIEAAGKFLIPGLWDMHSHPHARMFPLFVASGITGTRVMWGTPYLQNWSAEISAGSLLGPRMAIASPILDGPGKDSDPDPPWRIVSNADQARLAVRRAIQEGADFIKVYDLLSRDSYFAIADEAGKQRIPFVGHVPWQVTPVECSMAGQKSIEHVFGIERACSEGYESWRQAVIHAAEPAKIPILDMHTRLESFDVSRAAAIASVFRKNHTWLCPTLVTGHGLAGDPGLTQSAHLRYVGLKQKAAWAKILDNPDLPLNRRFQEKNLQVVAAMYAAGVGILAGTDTPSPYCIPGFAVHDELQLLVRANLTPEEALSAATYKPVEFLGKLDSLGTIERGKFAELVLLDANPLEDIANTKSIRMVITRGRTFRKPALEAMLQAAEAEARN